MNWAAVISEEDAHQLAALRLMGDVEVLVEAGAVWLRGPDLTDALDLATRKLSGAKRFSVGEAGELTPLGARVPTHRLPEGRWTPLSQHVVAEAPVAALAGRAPRAVALRLVRSGVEQPANVLVTDLATWHAYATAAPRVRLAPLSFAADSQGRIVVRGQPLPPIASKLLVESCGVAVPCGYGWEPPVAAEVVRSALGLGEGDLAILDPGGTARIIRQDCFVAAGRSAVRLTAGEIAHG
jgi:hypothetical protein